MGNGNEEIKKQQTENTDNIKNGDGNSNFGNNVGEKMMGQSQIGNGNMPNQGMGPRPRPMGPRPNQFGPAPNPQMMPYNGNNAGNFNNGPRPNMGPRPGMRPNPNMMYNNQMNQYNQQTGDNFNNKYELEMAFVGKKHKKLSKGFFSIWTLLFGPFYFLYRKLNLAFWIWMILDVFFVYYINKWGNIYIAIIFVIVLNLLMSLVFKFYYFFHVHNKIKGIKKKYGRYPKDQFLYICSKIGGTNGVGVFVAGCFSLTICVGLVMLYLAYHPRWIVDNVSVRIHKDFESVNYDRNGSLYQTFANNTNFCSINLFKRTEFTTVEDYFKDAIGGYEEGYSTKVTVNGKEWSFVEIHPASAADYYYYVTVHNSELYVFEYFILNNYGGTCQTYYDDLVRTLELN